MIPFPAENFQDLKAITTVEYPPRPESVLCSNQVINVTNWIFV